MDTEYRAEGNEYRAKGGGQAHERGREAGTRARDQRTANGDSHQGFNIQIFRRGKREAENKRARARVRVRVRVQKTAKKTMMSDDIDAVVINNAIDEVRASSEQRASGGETRVGGGVGVGVGVGSDDTTDGGGPGRADRNRYDGTRQTNKIGRQKRGEGEGRRGRRRAATARRQSRRPKIHHPPPDSPIQMRDAYHTRGGPRPIHPIPVPPLVLLLLPVSSFLRRFSGITGTPASRVWAP